MISPRLRRSALRCLSGLVEARRTGFVFDLDGVLFKGPSLIPGADAAIQHLYDTKKQRPRFPVCFLTNGGGVTETQKAAELSALLGVHVHENQVVMGHTPMRSLAQRFGDVPVLISGKGDIEAVAKSYGFSKAVTTQQLFDAMPSAAPFTEGSPVCRSRCPVHDLGYGTLENPFRSVMVMTDPVDWARDLQLITDVITSHGIPGKHPSGEGQSVELFIGHGDLLWANEFPTPRFGLGAFSLALQTLYQAYTGTPPSITHFGKPTPIPFRLVEELLRRQSEKSGHGDEPMEQIFMVGDNPAADVRGARNAGPPWIPVLVQTGVFRSFSRQTHTDAPDIVSKDVLEFIHQTV